MSKQAWENLNQQFYPTSVLIGSESDYIALSDTDYFKEITPISKQIENMNAMSKSVMTIIYLLIAVAILLSVIILYNLGMLNYIERVRDFATMKVLGFKQKEIRSMILKDGFLTTIIGWLIGLPLGHVFLNIYIGVVLFNSFEWIPYISVVSQVIVSLLVIICCLSVNLFISHKVKKIDMVGVLKPVE